MTLTLETLKGKIGGGVMGGGPVNPEWIHRIARITLD